MEQSGISIISPGVTENSVGKAKSIGITLRTNSTLQSAKEKLKAPWLKKTEEGSTWDKFLILLAELIGTAILIFLGCTIGLGSMNPYHYMAGPSVIQISLAFGLAVMVAIQCVGHISGADLNPAVTIASVILGKKTITMAGFYIIVQCLGSLLGFGLLQMITPSELRHNGDPTMATNKSFCMTDVNEDISLPRAVVIEALATGILVLFACGSWDSRNAKNSDSLALKFGLCITVLCLAFMPQTGCSMNPARTFGPAIWNGYWDNHWVYWVGPIGGGIIAALLYRCLFSPSTKSQENTMQDVGTLNGIET